MNRNRYRVDMNFFIETSDPPATIAHRVNALAELLQGFMDRDAVVGIGSISVMPVAPPPPSKETP